MQIVYENGGQQWLVVPAEGSMAIAAREAGHEVYVIPFYGWIRAIGQPFFDRRFIRRQIRNSIAVFQLIKLVRKKKASIIFSNTSVINIGAWAGLFLKARHLWYVHEMGKEDFGFRMPFGKFSYRFMRFTSYCILTNSLHLQKRYVNLTGNHSVKIIRNPVLIKPIPSEVVWQDGKPFKLLLLGQIRASKGHLVAVEAIVNLIGAGVRVSLSIIGNNDDKLFLNELKKSIESKQLTDAIKFEPYQSAALAFSRHHVMLMTSYCEAFGRVTLEAMKAGIPVVGANSCGTSEIITHLQNGYLFEPGNAIDLAAKIQIVANQPALREKIIKNAKKTAEEFTNSLSLLQILKN